MQDNNTFSVDVAEAQKGNPQKEDKSLYRSLFVAGKDKDKNTKISVYAKKFAKLDSGEDSWNWCAFLIGPVWFFYRKMIKLGLIYVVIATVLEIIAELILSAVGVGEMAIGLIQGAICLAFALAAGTLGDKLYMQRIDNFYHAPNREEARKKYGGTSWLYVLAYLLISTISTAIFGVDI